MCSLSLCCCAVARTTTELHQAQLADPVAALHYQHQQATQPTASPHLEASPAPQSDYAAQLDPVQSLPHDPVRECEDQQGHETEETDAPGSSAAHSKPASLGLGRLKKVKLAAQAEGSQDVGSKRRRDQDTGISAGTLPLQRGVLESLKGLQAACKCVSQTVVKLCGEAACKHSCL